MTLLDIHPKSRKGSYLWEHALKSIYMIVSTFGVIFLILMFIGYKKGGRKPDPELMEIKKKLFDFFLVDHLEVTILICLMTAGFLNLLVYLHNRKKLYVIKIETSPDNETLTFTMISTYSDESVQKIIPLKDCRFFEQRIRNFGIGSHKVVSFGDEYGVEFGRIDLTNEIHAKSGKQVKFSLKLLNDLKPVKLTAKKNANTDPTINWFGDR